jgi:hypothetical protein
VQAAATTLVSKSEPALYRPRKPQLSDLYRLLEAHYDDVKAHWEDRFEKAYGYWRGFVDNVVLRYFDCGVPEGGFARIVCEDCRSEFLLCFSCKARNLCPSCDAKRAAAFAAFLQQELLEDVGHAVWSFSIPKMLRPYFLFHRELLTELARAGYETVHQLMAAAVDDKNVRVGMVASIQTFSDNLVWNPHLHCVVSRGVFCADGQWIPVPYVDTHAAEILFREKVFRLLQEHHLLSDERIKILRSWRRSGFSIDNDVYLYPSDTQALEILSRYIVRCPVSLRRLHYDKKSSYVLYQPKSKNRKAELLDPLEFLARVLIHIPQPNQHSILYYGHYARRTRKHTREKRPAAGDDELNATKRRTLRRRWANWIRRVFKTDPLICKNCGGKMRVVSFITEPSVISQILDHLENRNSRDPPLPSAALPRAQ